MKLIAFCDWHALQVGDTIDLGVVVQTQQDDAGRYGVCVVAPNDNDDPRQRAPRWYWFSGGRVPKFRVYGV